MPWRFSLSPQTATGISLSVGLKTRDTDAKKLFKGKKREAEVFFTNSFNKVEELNKIYQHKLSELKREYDKNLQICDDKMKLDEEYSEAKFYIEKEWEENVSKLEDGLEEEEILQGLAIGTEEYNNALLEVLATRKKIMK